MKNAENRIKTVFLAVVALIILLPALFTNIKKDQRSEINNTMLAEFPAFDEGFFDGLSNYADERVGFRTGIITAYQEMNIILFHYLVHPLYEYGKDDWIMTKGWDQIQTLHLDVPEDYVKAFGKFVSCIDQYSEENGAKFLFLLVPNKETIYYEKLSDGYNIKPTKKTKSDLIIDELNRRGVNNLYLRKTFLDHKDEVLLYNKKFDAGHWNDNGAFYGLSRMYDHLIDEMDTDVDPIKEEDFDIDHSTAKYLLNSFIWIDEEVPVYNLNEVKYTLSEEDYWSDFDMISENNYHTHTFNEQTGENGNLSVLLFCDSYLLTNEKFFANNFREFTMIHGRELPRARYYIEKLQPDIVIMEATERVIGPGYDYNIEFMEQMYE